MLKYPVMNPIAFSIGPVAVHWYGLMYLLGFAIAWSLAVCRGKKTGQWTSNQVSDLIFYSALGVIVGGRLGYMLFYDFSGFWHNPLNLFKVWDGGMSFHGGLIGVCTAVYFYSRALKRTFWSVMDFGAPLVPIGLGLGRIGNFINGELWGRVSQVPWAMVFPNAGPLPRHPSQLYEFFLEGVVLFLILWIYSSKPRPTMAVSALFLLCYGVFRFFVEFFRQPDPQLGFIVFGWLTMGQLLSVPMIVAGLVWLIVIYCRTRKLKAPH